MLITELDAVNGVLQELGEQPLTSLDTTYPTVGLAQTALNTARLELLQRGWWFNMVVDFGLNVDQEGKFKTPDNTLEFIPNDPKYLWVGSYVMESNGNVLFPLSSPPIKGKLKVVLAMTALPWSAQQLIMLNAASKVYVSDFGPDSKYQEIMIRARELQTLLSSQHIRAKHPSMRNRPAVREYYNSLFT